LFLEEVKKHGMPLPELRGIVEMMPESVIDDEAADRAAVRKRIRSLSTVKDPGLSEVRDEALAVLKPPPKKSGDPK
jgi:hypothetical protein